MTGVRGGLKGCYNKQNACKQEISVSGVFHGIHSFGVLMAPPVLVGQTPSKASLLFGENIQLGLCFQIHSLSLSLTPLTTPSTLLSLLSLSMFSVLLLFRID